MDEARMLVIEFKSGDSALKKRLEKENLIGYICAMDIICYESIARMDEAIKATARCFIELSDELERVDEDYFIYHYDDRSFHLSILEEAREHINYACEEYIEMLVRNYKAKVKREQEW